MKTALLSISTEKAINIGDYIQALASSQFMGKDNVFIEREKIDEYDGDDVMMIMNGWFMHHSEHWPPSNRIHPLYVAFHLNDMADKQLLSDESISYLKQFEPIGCRDKKTVEKLQAHGVKAYFSACMTLTLGYKYHSEEKDGKVYITDPIVSIKGTKEKVICLLKSLINFQSIYCLYKKEFLSDYKRSSRWIRISKFFLVYSKLFDKKLLQEATYITQESEIYHKYETSQNLLDTAESLVKSYAKASCVITSRIHCALPCLGVETPVIYIYNDMQDEVSACRLDGLKQLFNIVHYTGNKLIPDFKLNGNAKKISKQNFPKNKEDWKGYADTLIKRCQDFINPSQSVVR